MLTIVHITYHDETNIGSCPISQTGGFENADGNGEIHCFRIFDGVSVMLMQLEMGSYTEIRTQVGVLEVNFCINGRFETSFSMRSHVLLKPGTWLSAATTVFTAAVRNPAFRWATTRGSVWR